jgi:hypothetical protein
MAVFDIANKLVNTQIEWFERCAVFTLVGRLVDDSGVDGQQHIFP